MDTTQIITLILATIGTVLGIINTYNLISNRWVRLKVTPALGFPDDSTDIRRVRVCIEVSNLSSFDVTVREVGFILPDKKKLTITKPETLKGSTWPRRLRARESVTVFCNLSELDPKKFRDVKKAYAITDCGVKRMGTSPALKQLIQIAEKIS